METKTGTIKSVSTTDGRSEKGAWTMYVFKMEDGKSYSTFDAVIGKAFGAGDSVEFTGEQKGQYWNLKTMNKIKQEFVRTGSGMGAGVIIKPQDWRESAAMNKNTTMYTSYAKDIFIAIYEKNFKDCLQTDLMNSAIELVKQAREAFQ